jgi:PAS domain S-box-containing protein
MSDDGAGSDTYAAVDFLSGGGEMGARMRALNWERTALGPREQWPQSLKTIVRMILDSRYAMWMLWGRDLTFFCNDAYLPTVGIKRDWVLGARSDRVWEEIWPDIGPRIHKVLSSGHSTWDEGLLLFLGRSGFLEETYHTFSYSPLYDDHSHIAGMLCVVTEVTNRVIGERQLRVLRDLAARSIGVKTVQESLAASIEVLAQSPFDVPVAAVYLSAGSPAQLVAATRPLPLGCMPAAIDIAAPEGPWPVSELYRTEAPQLVDNLPSRGIELTAGVWPDPIRQALVLPIKGPGQDSLAGFVVIGLSPRRVLDDGYRSFVSLIAGQIAAGLADAQAYEAERARAEALAEINRAKSAFFSNVSHEFRTPLTLMLGPVEDAINSPAISAAVREQLGIAQRNALRLLRLVNSLLDFSRIEAGRTQAAYQPTDLATLTRDLASTFRSAMERAGLSLRVDCAPLDEPVYIDREMWEKVVLNLLSNAFKFTLQGEVAVRLRREKADCVLDVIDTGVGVPAESLPRLFERFYRVEGAQGRTHEGSGIGLALVQELVNLHRGSIEAKSLLGKGATFTVRIPFGTAHLPEASIVASVGNTATPSTAQSFVQEALRWLPDSSATTRALRPTLDLAERGEDRRFAATFGARIVLADDNADMRAYVLGLLTPFYVVEAVGDGEAALAAARRETPDLVLCDIMMPRLDGFGLLRGIRADETLRRIPVVLVSARAGEEARIGGFDAGADDYLIKPFSARELLARVGALLELQQMRRISEQRLRLGLTAARMVAWELNLATKQTRFSDNARDVLGGEWADLSAALSVVHADDRERFRAALDDAAHTGGMLAGEFRICRPDNGEIRWMEVRGQVHFDAHGTAVNMSGVALDVTKRKEIEALAAGRTAQFETLLTAAPLGVYLIDADFKIREMNPTARAVFGDIPQLIGRDFEEAIHILWPKAHADWVTTLFRRTLETGESYRMPEHIEDRRDRRVVEYYEWQIHRIPLPDGHYGVVCYFRDISAQVLARQQIERANRELEAADRQKNEFLAMLAHELRNPLAPVRNSAELLARTMAGDPRAENAINMIKRQVTQLTRLVDDLLDVSRITQGRIELKRQPLEIGAIIGQAMETVEPLLRERQHRVAITSSYEALHVNGDAARLVQCLVNVLTNAAKFTDVGGTIRVETRVQGTTAVIEIADSGVGISSELLPRIFTLFVQSDRTLDRSQGGLGIGLSVVKRLIEMHNGQVSARSAGVGQGAIFEIRLPLIERPGEIAHAPPPFKAPPRRVLVVDDNVDAAASLALLLMLDGHETEAVNSAHAALEFAKSFKPDVVLLDIGLPEMDGYEVALRLRKLAELNGVRLIALTGYGQSEDRERARAVGFDDHLVKPVEFQALERALAGRMQ